MKIGKQEFDTKLVIVAGLALLIGVVLAFSGCAPPYRQEFSDTAGREHWTKKQELLAFAYADKIFWSKELKNNGQDSGQYVFIYSRVPVEKVAAQLEATLKDLNEIQNPKFREWRKYGEVYNLKKDFEHEEEIEKTIYVRVHAADLENQLKKAMGEAPTYGPEAEALNGYNIKRIYVNKPLSEAFPFKSDQVEGAKKDGTLKTIETAELDLSSTFDHKDFDPDHPDDANAFVWKSKKLSIRLTNYKIINTDKPADNNGNYIEGYRVVDGKQESVPCLKVFFPPEGYSAIALLDPTREGEPGYGVPELMETLSKESNVQGILRNERILSALFAEPKKDKRAVPPAKIFKVEVSRLDNPIDPWQHDSKGYSVPVKYHLGMGDNYNVRIKFAKPNVDPNDPEAVVKAHSGYLDIEWIAKEYTQVGQRYSAGPGRVVEYYRPKKDIATHIKARVLYNDDTKKIELQFPDGTTYQGFVTPGTNKFIEDKPFAVAYTEGEKRWWLEKEGGDLYTKRKQVSPPKESTGSYGEGDITYFQVGERAAGPSEGDVDLNKGCRYDIVNTQWDCPKPQERKPQQ